ncbi:hypothetical protein ACJX0J_022268 [Zea mays]
MYKSLVYIQAVAYEIVLLNIDPQKVQTTWNLVKKKITEWIQKRASSIIRPVMTRDILLKHIRLSKFGQYKHFLGLVELVCVQSSLPSLVIARPIEIYKDKIMFSLLCKWDAASFIREFQIEEKEVFEKEEEDSTAIWDKSAAKN